MSKPAFPRPISGESHNHLQEDCREVAYQQEGMSLLEYYAGQADIPWEEVANAFMQANGCKKATIEEIIKARAELRFDDAEAMVAEAEKRSQ